MIRNVRPEDAEAIATIYNHYITDTLITFETESITAKEVQRRVAETQSHGFPWIVKLDANDQIVGYAYADYWRKRIAYRHSVESAVYVSHEQHGKGYGNALYVELLERLRASDSVHVVVGVITVPNEASIALHKKLGFAEGAIYREVGRKFDQWIDVQTLQLKLR
jgi:phosphinothricin acetyltransferase